MNNAINGVEENQSDEREADFAMDTSEGDIGATIDAENLDLLRALPVEDRLEFARNLGLPPDL